MRFTSPRVLERAINCRYSAFTADLFIMWKAVSGCRHTRLETGKHVWLRLFFPACLPSRSLNEDVFYTRREGRVFRCGY